MAHISKSQALCEVKCRVVPEKSIDRRIRRGKGTRKIAGSRTAGCSGNRPTSLAGYEQQEALPPIDNL